MSRWVFKALAQKVLSCIPAGKKINYGLQLASGAHSETAERRVPELLRFLCKIDELKSISNANVLEVSTGWNAINAVLFSLLGAKEVVATDYVRQLRLALVKKVVRSARKEADLIASIRGIGSDQLLKEIDLLLGLQSEEAFLRHARITYLAPVDACNLEFDDRRFDIVYSCRVLAHFPENQLPLLAQEIKRLLKPGGVVVHSIGLQDPYYKLRNKNKVAFLTYSDKVWRLINSELQSNNRLRASQHAKFYTDLGAEVIFADAKYNQDDIERLKQMSVDSKFSGLTLEDLATSYYDLVCRF